MKKRGFTLTEILIAVGLIGIIAAITVPSVSNIMPNQDKLKVLKIYKTVTDINEDLLNDTSLYLPEEINENMCTGLDCTQPPMNPDFNNIQGSRKYIRLLTNNLKLQERGSIDSGANPARFITADGNVWELSENRILTVDISGNGQFNGCTYSLQCLKPDKFSFSIDNRGRLTGIDALTKAYLENPNKLNDKKKDLKRAKEILNSQN